MGGPEREGYSEEEPADLELAAREKVLGRAGVHLSWRVVAAVVG